MGIQGLLPLLKDIQVRGNIKEYKGKRLAVDAYVWLHKGAFGCAEDLVKGKKTTKFVDYAMYRVRLLRHHGITPFIVFDGGPLPAKKGTEVSRAKSRADNLARAVALESQGRLKEARDFYTKCVDITPEMAYQLIKALRAENVDYVVAPYEADAQLCYLEREGYVDGIITEDSDLLVFGCRNVIFKLDGNGDCVWIHRERLATVVSFPMHGWTEVQFRRMAMLSGCDYLESISGMGLKTAHRLLRKHKTVEKVLTHLRLEGAMRVPDDYAVKFAQAELAFIHQRVYDPSLRRLIPLNDFPDGGLNEEDEKWIGLDLDVETARQLARGNIHPETLLPIGDQWPDYRPGPFGKVPMSRPILGNSSQENKPRGPLDAFFSRQPPVKRPRSTPLPAPVGTRGSGPAMLSDLVTSRPLRMSASTSTLAMPQGPAGQATRSKFFGSKTEEKMEAEVEKVKAEMLWESSTTAKPSSSQLSDDAPDIGEAESQDRRALDPRPNNGVDGRRMEEALREASVDHVRSPSPIVSSLRLDTSPPRPMNIQVMLSSPAALSSPEPSSPCKRAAFSSPPLTPVPRPAASARIMVDPFTQSSSPLDSKRAGGAQAVQLRTTELDPDSSGRSDATLAAQVFSDGIDDDILVTPSFEAVVRPQITPAAFGRRAIQCGKRKRGAAALEVELHADEIEEIDDSSDVEEAKRAEAESARKATVFGAALRDRFACRSTPRPGGAHAMKRSRTNENDTPSAGRASRANLATPSLSMKRHNSAMPLSAFAPGILQPRDANVARSASTPLTKETAVAASITEVKIAARETDMVTTPTLPAGAGGLSRFAFVGTPVERDPYRF